MFFLFSLGEIVSKAIRKLPSEKKTILNFSVRGKGRDKQQESISTNIVTRHFPLFSLLRNISCTISRQVAPEGDNGLLIMGDWLNGVRIYWSHYVQGSTSHEWFNLTASNYCVSHPASHLNLPLKHLPTTPFRMESIPPKH